MTIHLFSMKFFILLTFILSAFYIHVRGKIRYNFLRQLGDHSTFMAPINAVMYLFSNIPNTPYINVNLFPELDVLKEKWELIKEEAESIKNLNHIKSSANYDDIGFNSFFRSGWKRFYLKWYDEFLPSAEHHCPNTVALLKNLPQVNAAMFALLPKGSRLVRHRDPYAGSLRYHLGLITPNSDQCRIFVDGVPYAWKDGEAVMFDETYIHYAENETEQDRIILFCDIRRPMKNKIATWINTFFCKTLMAASATKNLPGDRLGFINKIFKYLYQVRLVGKRLKKFNKPLYYFIKYALFAGIFYLIFI